MARIKEERLANNIGSTIVARAVEQRPFDRPYKPNGDYYLGGTDELASFASRCHAALDSVRRAASRHYSLPASTCQLFPAFLCGRSEEHTSNSSHEFVSRMPSSAGKTGTSIAIINQSVQ